MLYLASMNGENDFLYEENILEHYRNPKNKKAIFLNELEKQDQNVFLISGIGDNPDCGDEGALFLKLRKEENDFLILESGFTGNGCAISQSAFDMMTGELNGKSLSEIRLWTPAKIYELLGIQITPSRVNCALLCYRALEKVLKTPQADYSQLP